jgi:hypothetical protein
MTKEQVVNILNGMDCEIAQIKFYFNGGCGNILVYLVNKPSIEDQIINSNHLCIIDITEFIEDIETNGTADIISVTEFISDFDD